MRRVTILRSPRLALRNRKGVALVLTMLMTFAIGALAMAAIYLTSNGHLIGGMADREKELRYAADASLQIGKSLLNNDPIALPDSGYRTLVTNGTLKNSSGQVIPNLTYNLYIGPTGSTTGQFGRFASVVSEAVGPRNARFVRRLELEQESFARYAYWTNVEKDPSGNTIYFGGGDVLWGPVWSNDVITIHSTGATFKNEVGTAKSVSSAGYGTFEQGYSEGEPKITLPTVTSLTKLPGYATAGNLNFTAPTTGDETGVRMRLEFVAVDLNGDGDSTDVDEGFVKVYEAKSGTGKAAWLRGDWNSSKSDADNCGDYHKIKIGSTEHWAFYPVSVHSTSSSYSWARNQWSYTGSGVSSSDANTHAGLSISNIMKASPGAGQPGPRCLPGGHPHLVAINRTGSTAQKGGMDSTFTPPANDNMGAWKVWPGAVDSRLTAIRPWDAQYMFPLYRGQNPGFKGVIYVNGTTAVSGVLRGRITLYAKNNVVLIDDLRYATDPGGGICNDMLGIIAGKDIVVANNGIATPQDAGGYKNFDDTKDFYIHGVMMALDESFRVEDYGSNPSDANDCAGIDWGRGCLFLTGGLIQERRGAVGTTAGTGFLKRYSYDRCVIQIPPPYFPTTGRFLDNRYSEIDPARFDVASLFASLAPGTP